MQVQLMSHVPGVPGPISSAHIRQEDLDLSMVVVVVLSWSHWLLYHVVEEASEE